MRSLVFSALLLLLMSSIVNAQEAGRNILFIVDGSGSMWGKIEGETKIEITQRILAEQIRNLSPDVNAGLIAYGHRRDKDCQDIETLVDLKPFDQNELLAKLKAIRPKSMTPIASSIELAAKKLIDQAGTSSIILMSDGKETCNVDPCEVVKRLREQVDFTLHVVGFDISDEQDALQLQCIARAGGGNYYTAATVEGLDEAFREATKQGNGETASRLIQENTEIVLDTSAAMQQPFDGTTRLSAASQALEKVLELQVADRDNLAFRRFGGPCEGDNNTELVFEFAQNIAPSIVSSLSRLPSGGETTLVNAVNKAIDDFEPRERFKGVNKRIVIITGGSGSCYEHTQAISLIRQRLESQQINPEFRFIGVDIPPDQQQDLMRIADATNGEVSIVHTRAELESQLEQILEVEPADNDIKTITGNFNELIKRVGDAVSLINTKDYSDAEAKIAQLAEVAQGAALAFRDLGRRKSNEDFKKLFDAARELRSIQFKMIETVNELLTHHRTGERAAYNDSARLYNQLTRRYDDTAKSASETISRLREGASTSTAD